jgi:hypothetical protein
MYGLTGSLMAMPVCVPACLPTCADFGDNLVIILAIEGWTAAQQDEQHHPGRPYVRLFVIVPPKDLRGNVIRLQVVRERARRQYDPKKMISSAGHA